MHAEIMRSLDTKEKIFVSDHNKKYLYQDLKKAIRKFCYYLQKTPSGRIMISANQSFESYALLIATYLSGGTFCFMNPALPDKRKQLIYESFKPEIAFFADSEASNEHNLTEYNCLQVNYHEYGLCPHQAAIVKKYANDILYVYYTSGSTGLPKGCMIKRQAFENFCLEATKIFKLSAEDICGQYVPLWFDMSLIDIFGGVLKRATLIPFNTHYHKFKPGKFIAEHKITFMNVVPQFLDIIQNGKNFDHQHLKTLRMIRFGGDKVSKLKLDMLFAVCKNIEVVSTYGATESTCFCFSKILNHKNYQKHCSSHATVGRPIKGWYAFLTNVDEEGVGENVIYGDNIGYGYMTDNQKDNAYQKVYINKKLYPAYHTGDYFKIINHQYYFVGRKDTQVKRHGKRFDLNEIEYEANLYGISNVCAIMVDEEIYLFCEKMAEKDFSSEDLMKDLESKLPAYEIPTEIIFLDHMPYNPNGKIDRNKLKTLIALES